MVLHFLKVNIIKYDLIIDYFEIGVLYPLMISIQIHLIV